MGLKMKKHLILWYSEIVEKSLPHKKRCSLYDRQNNHSNQLPNELHAVFTELQIFKHLRQAGISKTFGFTCSYLFRLVFCLSFQHKNWFSLFESKKGEQHPAKDAVYRFLNHSTFNWRKSLQSFGSSTTA